MILTYKGEDILVGNEPVQMYDTTYSLVDFGDGVRCGWCYIFVDKIKKLDKHLNKHMKEEKL